MNTSDKTRITDLLSRVKELEVERDTLKSCLLQMQNAAKDLTAQLHQRDTALVKAREALESCRIHFEECIGDYSEKMASEPERLTHHALSQIQAVKP